MSPARAWGEWGHASPPSSRATASTHAGVTFHEGRINLLDRGAVSGFAQGVAEAGFGLIFIDTFARSMPGGDENSAKDVGVVVDALDVVRQASGAAVFALHHSTKEGSSARGLSAYLGACDTELEVSAVGGLVYGEVSPAT